MSWVQLDIRPSDLSPGIMVKRTVGRLDIAVAQVRGDVFAFADTCPHLHAALSEGELDDYQVYCPMHQSGFDIRTGQVCNPPARTPLTVYRVRSEAHAIWVDLPSEPGA